MSASAAAPEPSKASTSCSFDLCNYVLKALPLAQGLRVFASAAAPEPSKAERQVWFPGNKAPDYLDGSMPGDFGFDPLGLGSDPNTLRWCAALPWNWYRGPDSCWCSEGSVQPCPIFRSYRTGKQGCKEAHRLHTPGDVLDPICFGCRFQQAELVHSRTAMLGVAGILFPAVRLP